MDCGYHLSTPIRSTQLEAFVIFVVFSSICNCIKYRTTVTPNKEIIFIEIQRFDYVSTDDDYILVENVESQ